MDVKMFKRNDDSFICDVCNANVPKLYIHQGTIVIIAYVLNMLT